MDLGIGGRTAIVMAATSGLGLATAECLADEGVNVVACGRRVEPPDALRRRPNVRTVRADIGTAAGRAALLAAARAIGTVDILVLNNGGPPGTSAAALTSAAIASAATDSLLAHLDLVGATLPAMREQGWGRIIAIGSSGVREPIPGLALSNTLRAALAGYLKTLAGEVAAEGVTVNMVLPGRFATPRVHDLDAETARRTGEPVAVVAARSAAGIPTGRYGTPAEFAAVVAFLSSAAAGYVTGTQVRVDGGMARGW